MKYIKIAVIGLMFAVALSSCKQEDTEKPLLPGTGVVNFSKGEITVKENVGLFSIPLALTGEPGGYPVTVRVKTEVVSGAEKVEELAYITTETIKITELKNSFVQVRVRYVPEVDADSQIKITIESVNGAKIGTENTCLINIENIYAIRYGLYSFSCPNSGTIVEWTLQLRQGADGAYIMENLFNLPDSPKLVGFFDEEKKTLTFGGQLNGKGSDNYFAVRSFGVRDGNTLTLYGSGNGLEPIVFAVSDDWYLTSTTSSFQINMTKPDSEKPGEYKDEILGSAVGKSTLTYIGGSEEEEWPFN